MARVRATGFGLGYGLAIVLPSFSASTGRVLSGVTPSRYTALPLLVIGALLTVLGASVGPATEDVDSAEEVPRRC